MTQGHSRRVRRGRTAWGALVALSVLSATLGQAAVTNVWTGDATAGYSGTWTNLYQANVQAGWSLAAYPDATDALARVVAATDTTATNLLNVNATVGAVFADNRYGIVINGDGSHVLTFAASSGTALLSHSHRQSLTVNPDIVMNGPLVINKSGGSGVANGVTVNGSITGAGDLVLTNGINANGLRGFILLAGPVNMAGSLTVADSTNNVANQYETISGAIGPKVTTFTKSGPGYLTLAGANAYSGDTAINGGRVTLTNAATLGAGSVYVTATTLLGSALDLSGLTNAVNGMVSALSRTATLTLTSTNVGGTNYYGTIDFGARTFTNRVAALVTDGAFQPAGIYSSNTLPNYIKGSGKLQVVLLGGTMVLMR